MSAAVWTEVLKLRRSRLWWITLLAFTVGAGVGTLFMFIGQDPDRARSLGILGAKAQLATISADWPGHLTMLAQIVAVGGLLIFGIVTGWVFGREFSDHTVKDLLALPTPRTTIVLAKFAVTAGWSLALTLYLCVLALAAGAVLGLPGWSTAVIGAGLGRVLVTATMTILLTTPFALAASVGRGYLPAVGAMFLAVFCAQIIAALGYGRYFPWSVPALYTGMAGPDSPPITGWSVTGVVAVGALAVAATVGWWRYADQTR